VYSVVSATIVDETNGRSRDESALSARKEHRNGNRRVIGMTDFFS